MPLKPASLRQQQTEQTRVRLMEAARLLFTQHGVNAVSIDAIARAAGASRATFYLHFRGKDGVLQALLDEGCHRTRELYFAFGELPDWSPANVRGWIEQMFLGWEEFTTRTAYLIDLVTTKAAVEYDRRYHKEFVAALLHRPEHWRHLRREEAERRASMLLFQLERTMHQWVVGRWRADRRDLIESFVTVWTATWHAADLAVPPLPAATEPAPPLGAWMRSRYG